MSANDPKRTLAGVQLFRSSATGIAGAPKSAFDLWSHSFPLCLCRPWRSAARLQACFRRSMGGFSLASHRPAVNVRSGLEAVIALPLIPVPPIVAMSIRTRFGTLYLLKMPKNRHVKLAHEREAVVERSWPCRLSCRPPTISAARKTRAPELGPFTVSTPLNAECVGRITSAHIPNWM
jgi:hypothetical protein